MEYNLTLSGTGFDGRDKLIRQHVREGAPIHLVREPDNKFDRNAIGAYIELRPWFFPFISMRRHIGYINKTKAASIAKRIDAGGKITRAYVRSFYAPDEKTFPRVSIVAITDW